MGQKQYISILLLILLLCAASCSPTRRLADGQYLLVKNRVIEADPLKASEKDDIADYVIPKTNKKFLGFWRFYLQLYNLPNPDKLAANKEKQLEKLNNKNREIELYNATVTNPKKKKKLKKEKLLFGEWLQKIGEAPVILDSARIRKSRGLLADYAQSKGFFQAYVTDSIIYKKKKAYVNYTVHRGPAYYVDTIMYDIRHPEINTLIENKKSGTKLKDKMKYDLQKFDDERKRITDYLKNEGYFLFNKDYLRFTADTVTDTGHVRLTLKLINPDIVFAKDKDTIRVQQHKKFKINEVYIIPNYQIDRKDITSVDTVKYKDYTFIYYNKINYNPKILAQSVFFEKGKYYKTTTETRTQKAFSDLRNFKYIHIRFDPVFTNDKDDLLNCYIELSPTPKQNLGLELQGTNTDGNLGVSLSATYSNKNIFKGAELLEFRLYGGAEIQIVQGDSSLLDPNQTSLGPFNTFEVGAQLSILTNRFLFPIRIDKIKKWSKPKTRISLGFNYQTRPDYQRWVGSITFGYEWTTNRKIKHILNPAEISLVKIDKRPSFEDFINSINDQFVRYSFIDHYIQGASYTFLYNTQGTNTRRDVFFFRGNLQWGGNILSAVSAIGNDQPINGFHTVFGGIAYAQYVRTELDFRYYNYLHSHHSLAFRGFIGVGVPYGNTTIMPFEKAFYIGGSNDLRAWLPRTLGPGAYRDTSSGRVDQVGDIKFLINAEYRVKIYRFIEGAVFADFGNIWLLRPDADRAKGNFDFTRFFNEFALGAGVGLRLNFNFFVFRLDVAIPMRDPSKEEGQRWVVKDLEFKQVRFNIAIGYPF